MFATDIKKLTKENANFRKVLYTGTHSQIVAMSIAVGEDIGEETHGGVDQILYFIDGECEATINGELRMLKEHDVVYVPAGTVHNFKNSGDEDLKLFTIYSPPEHADGTIHVTKEDAQKAEVSG
ncbi:hypothetical protein A3D80_03410 [Candidatus Roizmanbacteria bacterium RIFCSPHIGHO2_02_FULL_40_13b]|uniref:Cupin type-2 domain-containing protein n=1 Tax=Candidatus Roizmanbacteria bacterium RIFCSPHIGHO2_01_FULL_39_24 TaxID=1802032 RepID=A0A1F7GLD1_9BACT|nr:MAG: hypothetical protein A2799_01155 [Candidatus Roizmanbacteria bacterium RIFCSPHIGHO2_01_FULL_39_24]OGK27014.1 MAG: hypothetical protein A3D80_03410 [Candidatus Roizmanbacteria bacterium RIFCSPHIGHO2_02_FULL_40_13b]OGK48831.1 MAG: hypothetical protein A3A56_01315 [Candidatus Roizmanbacteria bacterium RIFCSPLOWO2_01_FULL_40_32]